MTVEERAYQRLRLANPAPVTVIEERPAASVALAVIQDRPIVDGEAPLRPRRGRTGLTLAAAVLLVLLLVGLPILLFRGTETTAPATDPAPPPTGALFDPGAAPLIEPAQVVQGSFLIEQLGTPLSLTFTDPWVLQDRLPGFILLTESATEGGSDGTLLLIRATELSNPADPFAPIEVGQGIAATRLETWLAGVDDAIEISGRVDVDLGGRSAVRFDLALDPTAQCGAGPNCAYLVTSRGYRDIGLARDERHRVWWIAEPGLDPIVIVARGSGSSLFDRVDAVLATAGFGVAAPHPVPALRPWEAGVPADAPAGVVRIPSLGGVQFDLAVAASIEPHDNDVHVSTSSVASTTIALAVGSPTGDPIESVGDAVEVLEANGLIVAEVDWSREGIDGRAFDIVRGSGTDALFVVDAKGSAWIPPASGRIWLFSMERGVLFVGSGALEGTFDLEEALAVGEAIAATIELIDLP
jgi:hypothetical protein